MNPFQSVLKWFLRVLLSFLVVTALLTAWLMIKEKYQAYDHIRADIAQLKAGRHELQERRALREAESARWLDSLAEASADQLLAQIHRMENEIRQKESAQLSGLNKSLALVKGDMTPLQTDVEVLVLKKLLAHLHALHAHLINRQTQAAAAARLASLHREHVAAYAALIRQEQAWASFRATCCSTVLGVSVTEPRTLPFSPAWQQLKKLETEYQTLFAANQIAHEKYRQQESLLNSIQVSPPEAFHIPAAQVEKVLHPLNEKIHGLEMALQHAWISHFAGPVTAAIPVAIGIIILAMLTPLLIKLFLYYIVAPLVSARRAICLMPDISGQMHGAVNADTDAKAVGAISAVSQEVVIDAQHELLIHPEYLQSTSGGGRKETKFLLDWHIPLTSLLAGLVTLTRIRTDHPSAYVVSSTKDPLSEVAVIAIPAGSAVVIQPRAVVGLVQDRDRPVVIRRRWQLNRLNAWLTLQLRYFIFHGPVKIIIKGCRGVRVERANDGRSINQAATIGFSANLVYAPSRCDTFVPYLRGKQALFNDRFVGEDGYYLYQEMPYHDQASSLLFGRGLEGVLDTFMKIFGI